MHRWHLQRVLRLLIPLLVLGLAVCGALAYQRKASGGRFFAADEAYASLAAARHVVELRGYALSPGQRMAVTRHVLWRLALAAAIVGLRDVPQAALLLGTACGVVTLLLTLRMARLLFPFPPYVVFSGVLLVLVPGFVTSLTSGTAQPLATCLVTAACLFHVEGLSGRRTVLSSAAAALVAAACWIRLEFALYWVALTLHAWLLGFRKSPGLSGGLALLRGVVGLLILALGVWPLVAWNALLLRVPWPRMPGVPLALDTWGVDPGEAARRAAELFRSAVPECYRRMAAQPLTAWWLGGWLWVLGAGLVLALGWRRAEERPFTVAVFLPAVLPVLYAIVIPYFGESSAGEMFAALVPLTVLLVAFGFFRVPFLIEAAYRRWKQGLPSATGFRAWWACVGGIVLVWGMGRWAVSLRRAAREVADAAARRAAVQEVIERHGLQEALLVSDEPGWLAYALRAQVLDLTGEGSPEVLPCVDAHGRLEPDALRALLKEREPRALVLWREENGFVESLVEGRTVFAGEPGGTGWPRVELLTWGAGF